LRGLDGANSDISLFDLEAAANEHGLRLSGRASFTP
jgi:hypothetical protein